MACYIIKHNNNSYLGYNTSPMGKALFMIWSNKYSPVQYCSSIFPYSKYITTSKEIFNWTIHFYFLEDREKRLTYAHGRRKSNIIIFFSFSFGLRILYLSKVHTFCQSLFVGNVLSLYIIMIIGHWFGSSTTQLFKYILDSINLLFETLTK